MLKRQYLYIFIFFVFAYATCSNIDDLENQVLNWNGYNKITTFQGSSGIVIGLEDEIALLKSFPKPLYKIYTVDSLGSFYIDDRIDIIKNKLRAGEIWEEEIARQMKSYVRPGSTAIDIGAHIGTHALLLSKLVGEEGHVVAFEPQVKLFSELTMNMLLNKRENVTAYRCAIGDTFKAIEMSLAPPENEGGTPVGKGGDKAEMIPLDSLNLDNVSFIKIDVENLEYEVLIGAKQTILRNRPYMVIEILGNIYHPIPNRQELVQEIFSLIKSLGYSLEYIEGSWSDWLAIPLEGV